MKRTTPAAAPANDEEQQPDIPSFKKLGAIPEIAALLEFEPVPRSVKRPDGWTAERQREFVARLAFTGSANHAAQQMGKNISGIEAIYRDRRGASFRGAWDRALEAGAKRAAEREAGGDGAGAFAGRAPGISVRGPARLTGDYDCEGSLKRPGEIRNEYGKWEDADSIADRAVETRDRVGRKLVRIRRLFLQSIAPSAGKRAAFEILTELPVDWAVAAEGKPQEFEPYLEPVRMREPSMVLTAEDGWLTEFGYGRVDRKAELRASLDEYHAEHGLPPIDWESGDEDEDYRDAPSEDEGAGDGG